LNILDLDKAVIVALGSNLGASENLLEDALLRLAAEGLPILARSGWWRSAAWPDPTQPAYRNGVAIVETIRDPAAVMETLLAIETALGRRRTTRNAPRTLDLDLIAHGRTILDIPDLTLPHPRAHERRFVMGPLAEIAPGWMHPLLGQTAEVLARTARVGMDAAAV
jgi:2-amino-4-hydroxy-6-hydroxymethyldihydropteridine diphosphokinase